MRYLVVAPQLGFQPDGRILPGGLLQFGRCVVRALSSSRQVNKLGIYCQLDTASVEQNIRRMVEVYAHPDLKLDIWGFGGVRSYMAMAVMKASITRSYDRVMYLLVNQSVLGLLPGHLVYEVWEIGEELFHPISFFKAQALRKADRLLSISHHTAKTASQYIVDLPKSLVIHLCLEPPLYSPMDKQDDYLDFSYISSQIQKSVLIVGNLHSTLLYKGHQQLIASWPQVVSFCPNAQLWIVGDGDGRSSLETLARALPQNVYNQITFWGRVGDEKLRQLYKTCMVFAMPSTSEGFGLVFLEAARYGKPCIGGKYDAVKEIIINGKTGILVEQNPDDIACACLKLLTNESLAKSFGEANKKRYLNNYQFCHFKERLLSALGLED